METTNFKLGESVEASTLSDGKGNTYRKVFENSKDARDVTGEANEDAEIDSKESNISKRQIYNLPDIDLSLWNVSDWDGYWYSLDPLFNRTLDENIDTIQWYAPDWDGVWYAYDPLTNRTLDGILIDDLA